MAIATKNWSAYQVFSSNNTITSSNVATARTSITNNTTPTVGTIRVRGGIAATSGIKGGEVYNTVWNDLADAIEVPDDTDLEYGYCYCFDGEKYYKSQKYLDDSIIGIHSDTAGFVMGLKDNVKEMRVAVSGFVLAHVDREYEPGTPLTCTCCGYLTAIHPKDKVENPEKIVATFWKPEKEKEWGLEGHKIKVDNRMWVKIKLS